MPSVAMKGGIFSLAMSTPETKPQNAPKTIAAGTPTHDRQAPVGQQHAGHHRAERHQRADREIDAAGDDDEGAGDRQHAVDRGRLQDADDVVGLHEIRRRDAEEHHQHDQAREREQLLRVAGPKSRRFSRRSRRCGGECRCCGRDRSQSSLSSPACRGFAPRGELHDLFLRGLAAGKLAGEPALAHHERCDGSARRISGSSDEIIDDRLALRGERVSSL